MITVLSISLAISIALLLGSSIYAFGLEKDLKLLKEDFSKRNKHLKSRVYELSILQEISRSISYSLSIQKVSEIIAGSLGDIVDYSVSSYLLYHNGKLYFKAFLNDSVSSDYVKSLEKRNLEILSSERDVNFKEVSIEESLSGSMLSNENSSELDSYSHVLLKNNDKVVGVISVSSIEKDRYKDSSNISLLAKITDQAMYAVENLQKLLILEKGKLSAMVESLADGVFYIDNSMEVLVSNSASKKMLDLSKSDVNILDIENKLRKIGIREKIEDALKNKKSHIVPEVKVKNKFLKVIISEVSGNKRQLGVVILMQDVTRQKELEEMRQDFTSMMVHDLRAPLTVMSGSADLLVKRETDLKKEQKTQLLFDIKKGADSLLDIVNDLLDVAKMEHGKFEMHPSVDDIVSFVKSKSEYYRSIIEERGIKYKVTLPDKKIKVNYDDNLIGRVLSNLLSNANKYTEEGTIELKLEKIEEKKKSFVKVSIDDTGVGISKKAQKHLFNKFEQLRNPVDSKQKGTGLGLVISKNIVTEHGGEIGVDSEPDKGSTFWFTLPVYDKSISKDTK